MIAASALLGLFGAAFLAATLVPFQSEVLFVGLQLADTAPLWALVLVASIGNTLGSFVNYYMGRAARQFAPDHRFAIPPAKMARAEAWFDRWGVWILLLSWAPLGDVITLIAGVLRTPVWLFGLLVGVAKTSRYIVLAGLTYQVAG